MPNSKPISFRAVRDAVMARIEERTWPAGTLLPTEMELAREFGCARATVSRALQELAERGIVDRRRKSGTRVVTSPTKQARLEIAVVRQTIEEMNATYRYALVSRAEMECPPWLAARMALDEGARVLHLQCLHHADNRPFQFEERWINITAVPHVVDADFSASGPNEWLLAEVPFSNAELVFSAAVAAPDVAEFLSTQPGTPLFQMERTTWYRNAPVTFVRMTFHQGYQMRTRY